MSEAFRPTVAHGGAVSCTGTFPGPEYRRSRIRLIRLTNSRWRIKARRAAVTDPRERDLWEDALDQVYSGWLDGTLSFDEEGRCVTGVGPQLTNPASRFGLQHGEKLRAVDDLKRRQADRAAAIQTPLKLPMRGHVAAIIQTFREKGTSGSLAMASAERRGAYKQLKARGDHKMWAVATLKDPASGQMRGFFSQTQLAGARTAVRQYSTVSRIMATMAVRLAVPRAWGTSTFS